MKKRQHNILKVVKKPKRNTELLDKIVQMQEEDEDLAKIVQEYWNDKVDHNDKTDTPKCPRKSWKLSNSSSAHTNTMSLINEMGPSSTRSFWKMVL